MEKEKATEVKCKTCEESRQVKTTERIVFIVGGLMFFLAIYGIVSLVNDIKSLF
jgi:hypothetical protein